MAANIPLQPETRAMFMKAVDALRAAGAEVIVDDAILPTAFASTASRVATYAYMQDGTNRFLAAFGPAEYHSAADYLKAVGSPLFRSSIGVEDHFRRWAASASSSGGSIGSGRGAALSRAAPRDAGRLSEPLDRLRLDGYVYPAIQMPPPDETMPQDGGLSGGPHSNTSWVNMIGVPAVVVPAGTYASGLPFGLEFSARPWTDGDLLAIASRGSRRRACASRPCSWSGACSPRRPRAKRGPLTLRMPPIPTFRSPSRWCPRLVPRRASGR